MPKTLIVLVGPTAIGKTSTGINIARHFNSEIVFFENDADFQVSFSLFNAVDNSQLSDNTVTIDGNLQYKPDFFLNLAVITVNTPVNSLTGIVPSEIESYFALIPNPNT